MLYGGAISLCVFWCVMHQQMQFNRRLNMVDAERSKDHLAAAESMLDAVQADMERTHGTALLLAEALRERALIRDDEGRSREAIPLYERAVAIFRSHPQMSGPPFLGLTLANLASAYADCGDFERALTLTSEAMTSLRAGDPEFAVALYARGTALHGLDRHQEALRDLREALSIWEAAAHPDRAQMALLKDSVAACLRDLGFSTKAEAAELESLALRTQVFGPDSLGVAESLNNLGVMMARDKRYTESEQSFEKAELILERIGEPGFHHLISVLQNLGSIYLQDAPRESQLYAKAERVFRRKLAIEEQLFGAGDIRLSATLEMLGEALYGERAYNDAGQTYGRGVALQVAAFGPSDPRTQAALKRQTVLAKKMRGANARN
jgi:tetratricopeptide (TPR) repeat protein